MATSFYGKVSIGGGGGGGGAVDSVNGYTGVVVLGKSDIGLNNVDNTSDANKPISTATQTALNAKQNSLGYTPVNKAGDTMTGTLEVADIETNNITSLLPIDLFLKTPGLTVTTNNISIKTGNSSFQDSGDITIQTGTAAINRGAVVVDAKTIGLRGSVVGIGNLVGSDYPIEVTYTAPKAILTTPNNSLEITGAATATGALAGSNLSGTNTGDETDSTIKTKLGAATSSADGYLTSTDWNSFDARMPYKGSVSYVTAVVANSAPSVFGTAAPTITGTASAVTPTVTSYYTSRKILECTASAISSAIAGWRFTTEYVARGGSAGVGGFKFSTTFGFQAGFTSGGTNRRFYCGFTSSTVAPTDGNPSVLGATQDMFGLGLDNGDANFQIMHATGVANATKVDLGSSFARPTGDKIDFYRLDIHLPPNSGNYSYRVTNLISGAVASGTISSGVPAAGALLSPRCWVSAGGVSSAVGVAFEYIYLQAGE